MVLSTLHLSRCLLAVVSENETSKALLHKQANSKTTINKTRWYACYVQRLQRDEKHPKPNRGGVDVYSRAHNTFQRNIFT